MEDLPFKSAVESVYVRNQWVLACLKELKQWVTLQAR